jgi:hypothetical protein
MIFRPAGIIPSQRRKMEIQDQKPEVAEGGVV